MLNELNQFNFSKPLRGSWGLWFQVPAIKYMGSVKAIFLCLIKPVMKLRTTNKNEKDGVFSLSRAWDKEKI